jgi:hypothetical protein
MKILLSAVGLLASLCTIAQPASYSAASIPAALKEGAHVVKRYENTTFTVKDIDRATYSIHQVYTILDREGSDRLFFFINTDRLVTIDDVDIKVYNALGMQVNRFKKRDLNKQASQDGLIEDGVYHYLDIPVSSYPVTVEYKYETNFTGTSRYPAYYIQKGEEAVESSFFTAVVPPDLDLRYKQQNTMTKPSISYLGKSKVYTWNVSNLPAFKYEEGTVNPYSYFPAVLLAPNKFRHYNTYGEMTTWKSLGQWAYELTKGLDELPEERKAFFASMVKDTRTDREKVALIYKYLQQNFRYVSIQLGIGGVKPFPAKFTDEKKYGDCKGLSLYMLAALKAVGVKSHCALINSNYNAEPVSPEFPCDLFNHVILCVPQQKDSLWLECTSPTNEFAVLGTFTENRNALLLTENGGMLVATPKSKSSDNIMTTATTVKLAEDGSGTTTTKVSSRGDYRDIMNAVLTAKKDDQKQLLVRYLGFKQPDEFAIIKKGQQETLDVDIDLSIEKIPQFSAGSKMFLNPRVNDIWKSVLPKADDRKQDYFFKYPFIKTDTTIYDLPQGYVAESLPPASSLGCDFGTYVTTYTYVKEKNQVVSVARLELLQNRITAAKYAEVKKFFDSVMGEDTHKVVIKKG